MDFEKLQELIKIFLESGLSELEIEEDGKRARLQRYSPPPGFGYGPDPLPAAAASANVPHAPGADEPNQPDYDTSLPTIDAPMVGTFYRSPTPNDDPFVKEGDRVEKDATVCIVEAMKLMNEVGAKFACVIEKVLIENGEPVEFGQPLYSVRPL
ncbi:MAG: acetyl-CoA carboxylase biotin carboxyl carrier protein [Candidatus Hydrogenedentota bacterium]